MKQVYLKTKDGQYFVVRKIPDDKLELAPIDIQNGKIENTSTAPLVELHRKETQLAIVFTRGLNTFLLTVQKESESEVNLELKNVTDQTVQQKDYTFKYEDLGAGNYYALSTVETPKMYVYITVESVVSLTRDITLSVHVKVEVA